MGKRFNGPATRGGRCGDNYVHGYQLRGVDDWLAFVRRDDGKWFYFSTEVSPEWWDMPSYTSEEGPSDTDVMNVAKRMFKSGEGSPYKLIEEEYQAGTEQSFGPRTPVVRTPRKRRELTVQEALARKGYGKMTLLKRNPSSETERELMVYAENNSALYHQRFIPVIRNLLRKIHKGKYNHVLAVKLWLYYVDDAAQRYAKEYGGVWHKLFPIAERRSVAAHLAAIHYRMMMDGEYDDLRGKQVPERLRSNPLKELTPHNLREAKGLLRRTYDIILTKRDGEYRVNFRGGKEATAYYTTDLDDAVNTGLDMGYRKRTGGSFHGDLSRAEPLKRNPSRENRRLLTKLADLEHFAARGTITASGKEELRKVREHLARNPKRGRKRHVRVVRGQRKRHTKRRYAHYKGAWLNEAITKHNRKVTRVARNPRRRGARTPHLWIIEASFPDQKIGGQVWWHLTDHGSFDHSGGNFKFFRTQDEASRYMHSLARGNLRERMPRGWHKMRVSRFQ